MKGKTRNAARALAVVTALAATGSAQAMLVFDIPNFIVNKLSLIELHSIKHQLASQESGTVNNNTLNISKYTENMNLTLLKHYDSVFTFNQNNYDINAEFTWIIGTGGDEEIEIPRELTRKLNAVMGSQTSNAYSAHYKAATDYALDTPGDFAAETTLEGSRARKAANDALVESVATTQRQLDADVKGLHGMSEMIKKSQGTGHQLQVANALSSSQTLQLLNMRSMMAASEASHAAEAQVAADRDARAIAVNKHLNKGLENSVALSKASLTAY